VAFYKEAIELLKSQGAEVIEIELLKLTRPIGSNSVLYYEFKDGVNKYLATAHAKVKTVAEVIAFNKANEARAMPFFKQEILEMSEAKGGLNEKEYIDDLAKVIGTRKIIDDMMAENRLHAICSPSSGPASCIDLVNGSYSSGFSFSSPAAWSGYPHITVPMGYISDLPIGFSFIAGAWQEGEIIGMAFAYEQASKKRKAPSFKATL
jgi:amidase